MRIEALNHPNPPSLSDDSASPAQSLARRLADALLESSVTGENPGEAPGLTRGIAVIMKNLGKTLEKAGGQEENWQDPRRDLIEQELSKTVFSRGPIQGSPIDGQEVAVQLNYGASVTGEIFDRVLPPCDDFSAIERLEKESKPITQVLRRSLYPNFEDLPFTEHRKTSGGIDPSQLPNYAFKDTIFRRHLMLEQPSPRGKAVLLIACDGSASLNTDQMKMVKALATSWIFATARSNIRVLAALYQSGFVREGNLSGPLVQWIYHPEKTPATGPRDAVSPIASLPDAGQGAQADALSISFLLDEARRLSRGSMVYMILISDGAWNQCLGLEMTGREEVRSVFESAYDRFGGKLHVTLVGVGVTTEMGFEDLLDQVIPVPDVTDYAVVAARIGKYVAQCLRERNAILADQF